MESEFRQNQEQEEIKHRPNLIKQLNSCLYEASKEGRADVVEFSLSKDASIHFVDSASGNNSLWMASYNGHLKVVELLLSKGAYSNDVNITGQTAMNLATDESIKAVLRNWPTTMGILMFEELGLYTQPEAKFYIDLKEYIGAPK